MSVLTDAEVRRLVKFLRGQIEDVEKLAYIEDEMRGEFGAEFLRESDTFAYFPNEIIKVFAPKAIWKLKIISYTRMRMTQRGIGEQEVIALFEKFLRFSASRNQTIAVGGYTIYGKAKPRSLLLTLRIDVDETVENENLAHTVTVFVGRGDDFQTVEIDLTS